MEPKLESTGELFDRLRTVAESRGVYLIARFQARRGRAVRCVNGAVENASVEYKQGVGLTGFTSTGVSAFSSSDSLDEVECLGALGSLLKALDSSSESLHKNREIFSAPSHTARVLIEPESAFDRLDAGEFVESVVEMNCLAAELFAEASMATAAGLVSDEWRIFRTDGTDVHFNIPRCSLNGTYTFRKGEQTTSQIFSTSGMSTEVLLDEQYIELYRARADRAAALARNLIEAPHFSAGNYPILLDYSLAKGLAHEAFGHAAESDSLTSSILGDQGRFRSGERVAADGVNIVDESLKGDHAYQPYSSNGVPRLSTVIVKDGRLQHALSDLFSAGAAGVPVTGAARAESFASVPYPRMSNIRIDIRDTVPMDKAFEEIGPEEVRDLLLEHELLTDDVPVIYLSGYRGGQVNIVRGDFMFNCSAIYELRPDSVKLFRPAIFSGRVLDALQAIRKGFGKTMLDAIGYCSRSGQRVPSSGGSAYFVYLEKNPRVTIGGR